MIGTLLGGVFGFDADTVYLSPAPIYHSAPLGFCTRGRSRSAARW